jgi:tRNA 2-(methylsulfanyl)-N6-isopentenyladenosine37 hydroxylase
MTLRPTDPRWVEAALAELPVLLVDHAHCERRAAQTALRHAARWPEWPRLAQRLSRLAREELVHYERVLAELGHRGWPMIPLVAAQYGTLLFDACRPASAPASGAPAGTLGDRTVDEMLVCSLIEARSHERFVCLKERIDDARLADLYDDLLEAEARHGDLYLELATEVARGDVGPRRDELAAHEAKVLTRIGQPIRMHAGGH